MKVFLILLLLCAPAFGNIPDKQVKNDVKTINVWVEDHFMHLEEVKKVKSDIIGIVYLVKAMDCEEKEFYFVFLDGFKVYKKN